MSDESTTRGPRPLEQRPWFVLARDGVELYRGTEADCWGCIHRRHSFSVWHALRYEGFTIKAIEHKEKENER